MLCRWQSPQSHGCQMNILCINRTFSHQKAHLWHRPSYTPLLYKLWHDMACKGNIRRNSSLCTMPFLPFHNALSESPFHIHNALNCRFSECPPSKSPFPFSKCSSSRCPSIILQPRPCEHCKYQADHVPYFDKHIDKLAILEAMLVLKHCRPTEWVTGYY